MALAPCSLALAATRWPRFWGINLICLKVSFFVLFLPFYYSKTSLGSLGYILTLTLLLDLIASRSCFSCCYSPALASPLAWFPCMSYLGPPIYMVEFVPQGSAGFLRPWAEPGTLLSYSDQFLSSPMCFSQALRFYVSLIFPTYNEGNFIEFSTGGTTQTGSRPRSLGIRPLYTLCFTHLSLATAASGLRRTASNHIDHLFLL